MAKLRTAAMVQYLLLLLAVTCPSMSLQQQTVNKLSRADRAALVAIKDSLTDMPGSNFFSTWDFTSPDPCSTFSGITCFAGRVTTLTLGAGLSGSPGLAGSLSPFLSNLTQLTQLVLSPGLVTGPIPPLLGRLINLRVLSFTNNRLTGFIPSSISLLPNLHTLDLSYNQLSGSIPPALWAAHPELKVVILAFNKLRGGLPTDMSSTRLLHLDLKSNMLTGTLPLKLPSSLRYLSTSNNLMWGPLNGLESLSELVFLDLSMNLFSGHIPFSLFRPALSSLFLQRNNLSGAILPPPPPVAAAYYSYCEGTIVDLSHNILTGHLPPLLAEVESLYLNNNRFTGPVPREYVESLYRGTTKTLYLQHNYISGFSLEQGLALPQTASLCLSYNCMVPPTSGLTACPASAGAQLSRPQSQCSVFNDKGNTAH